jgi:SAM-dependent methyltransferase
VAETYDAKFYDGQSDSSVASARVLMPFVLELTGAKSVVDLGCGVGGWVAVAKELGAAEVLGVDGDYVDQAWLKVDADEFLPRDLTQPIRVERDFDLSMSLEVAEHLPPARAASFVSDLCALAPIVFFGAAQPHQGGNNHINEQYLDYWVELFAAEGYELIDCIRPRFWEYDISYHYSQNSAIFARPGYLPDEARGPRMPLRAVHPVLVECVVTPPISLRPWIKAAKQLTVALPSATKTTYQVNGDKIPVVGKFKRTGSGSQSSTH